MNKRVTILIIIAVLALALIGTVSLIYKEKQKGENLPIPNSLTLSYVEEGSNRFVQISWSLGTADYFNIYRAVTPEGPWRKVNKKFPADAGKAADYDLPRNAEILYYRVTSTEDDTGRESKPSEISSVRIESSSSNLQQITEDEMLIELMKLPPDNPTRKRYEDMFPQLKTK